MKSKGDAAGSGTERVLFCRRGTKRMTCSFPSNLFQRDTVSLSGMKAFPSSCLSQFCVNSLKVKGGWTAFQVRVAMAGRSGLPSSSAVCVTFSSHRRCSTGEVSLRYGATSRASLIISKTLRRRHPRAGDRSAQDLVSIPSSSRGSL